MEQYEGKKEKHPMEELFGRLDERLSHVEAGQEEIKKLITNQYVTQQEFSPVKHIVYGMVSIILITVMTAIVALVVHNVAK